MTREYITSNRLNELLTVATNPDSGKAEFIAIYQELYDKGFGYAGWAKGVVTKETITGVSAVNFMNIKSPTGEPLTPEQEINVNRSMITGYLNALKTYADDSPDRQTNQEVTYSDLEKFHERGFEANGLDIKENWTLYQPMKAVAEYFQGMQKQQYTDSYLSEHPDADEAEINAYLNSKEVQDAIDKNVRDHLEFAWKTVSETGGEGPDSLYESWALAGYVARAAENGDVDAQKWLQDNGLDGSLMSDFNTFIDSFQTARVNEINNYYNKEDINGMSNIYIDKRAEMIQAFLDRAESKYSNNEHSYYDYEKGDYLISTNTDYIGNNDLKTTKSEVIFGSQKNETIESHDWGDKKDFIFARDGDDIIYAGEGDDYIEGGKNHDTYHIEDHDTIFDSDMDGELVFGDKTVSELLQLGEKQWVSDDEGFSAVRV